MKVTKDLDMWRLENGLLVGGIAVSFFLTSLFLNAYSLLKWFDLWHVEILPFVILFVFVGVPWPLTLAKYQPGSHPEPCSNHPFAGAVSVCRRRDMYIYISYTVLYLGVGFKYFKWFFTPTWGRFPFWLISFRWVGTTNWRKTISFYHVQYILSLPFSLL